jgi:5'-3' exoribonuclease 1
VNILPFIDIALLKDTIATHCPPSKLTSDEKKRNTLGKVYFYRYDISCSDMVESPNQKIGLPDIAVSHSSVTTHIEDLGLSRIVFEPKLINGTQIPYPGFPSLNVMPIASAELMPIGLNCFGTPSKYSTMVLTMHPMPELPPIELLAQNVIGKSLFVNWPMMHEGRVVAVSDCTKEVRMVNGSPQAKDHSTIAASRWIQNSESMTNMYYCGNGLPGSGGICINEIKIRLKLLPLQGMKTNPSNGSTKKLFGKEEADVPLQLALWQAPAPDPRFIERGPMTLSDRFPEGCNCVLTKGKFRGCVASVVGIVDSKNVGVKVLTIPPEMPFGLAIARSVQETYLSAYDAARILRMSPTIFGKIMSRLQFEPGRFDLGLNLKSADGFFVVGYTRKKVEEAKGKNRENSNKDESAWAAGDAVLVVGSRGATDDEEDERITWEYTPKAVRLVEQYKSKFPQLFAAINQGPNERRYDANQVFGPNGEAWLPVVREWLDKHESAKLPRSPVTTKALSYEATAAVQKAADIRSLALKKKGYPKESLIKVPGIALYCEGSTGATDVLLVTDINDGEGPELGDRIVNLCADGVPFGARGTVIGTHEAATSGSVEVVMDEEFIGGTSLQGHCANFRGKLCHWSHLLRISPDNSKGMVDKLIPKEAQDAARNHSADQIVQSSVVAELPAQTRSNLRSQVDVLVERTTKNEESGKSKTPCRSSSRTGSAGRNRQGGWREARGPIVNDKKDTSTGSKGFSREGKSGLSRWRDMIKSASPPVGMAENNVDQMASDLKKMLNVSSESNIPAENQLKAMLGLTESASIKTRLPGSASTSVASQPTNISDGLKAILGVTSGPSPVVWEPTPTATVDASVTLQQQQFIAPVTAADKLLQIMSGRQQHGFLALNSSHRSPMSSPFNFTYVEEGKEAHVPPVTVSHPLQQQPVYHQHYPVNGIAPRMPPMIMQPASGYGSTAPQQDLQRSGRPLDQYPMMQQEQRPTSNIDFPPLGAGPPTSAILSSTNASGEVDTAGFLVPSAVKVRR